MNKRFLCPIIFYNFLQFLFNQINRTKLKENSRIGETHVQ